MTNFSQIVSFLMVSFIMIQSSVSESSKYLRLRRLHNDEHDEAEARNLRKYTNFDIFYSKIKIDQLCTRQIVYMNVETHFPHYSHSLTILSLLLL